MAPGTIQQQQEDLSADRLRNLGEAQHYNINVDHGALCGDGRARCIARHKLLPLLLVIISHVLNHVATTNLAVRNA
jgi:hypothetical protein